MSLGKNTRYSCMQGNLTEGEGSGTVDLHVLTSLDKLLFLLNILYKTCYLNEEVTCTMPSFSFPRLYVTSWSANCLVLCAEKLTKEAVKPYTRTNSGYSLNLE
jgi:hypothetical protein